MNLLRYWRFILLLFAGATLSNLSTGCTKSASVGPAPAPVEKRAGVETAAPVPFSRHSAGGDSSGGGASVVCRDAHGKVISAVFYDLYAAENDADHTAIVLRSEDSVEAQIERVLDRTGSRDKDSYSLKEVLRRGLGLVKRDWKFIKEGTYLPFVPDVKPDFLPKHCGIETTAHYSDKTNILRVDKEIFDKLSRTDQAALYVHEAVYKMFRVLRKDKDSVSTRNLVRRLFTSKEKDPFEPMSLSLLVEHDFSQFGDKQVPMEYIDFILGGKSLYCQSQQDAKKYIKLKTVRNAARLNFEKVKSDKLFLDGRGTLLWWPDDASVEFGPLDPGQDLTNIKQPQEHYVNFKSEDVEFASLLLSPFDLIRIFIPGEKTTGYYSTFPEQGEEIVNMLVVCELNNN